MFFSVDLFWNSLHPYLQLCPSHQIGQMNLWKYTQFMNVHISFLYGQLENHTLKWKSGGWNLSDWLFSAISYNLRSLKKIPTIVKIACNFKMPFWQCPHLDMMKSVIQFLKINEFKTFFGYSCLHNPSKISSKDTFSDKSERDWKRSQF